MENYKNLASVIRSVVTEAHKKDHYDSGWKKPPQDAPKDSVEDKMRRAKQLADLARKAMQQKMKESFDLDITYEEADDLLNSIQESTWLDEYGMDADAHEKVAAKHLKDADAHKKSGNMPEHYAALIRHYTSKAKAHEKRTPPPRGTGPS